MVEESVPSSIFYKRRVDETLHQAQKMKIYEMREDNSALEFVKQDFIKLKPLIEIMCGCSQRRHINILQTLSHL